MKKCQMDRTVFPMARSVSAASPPIAVVGVGCIFPGSSNLKGFWNLLFNGTDAISQVSSQTHWDPAVYFDPDPLCRDHVYCKRGGFLPRTNFNPLEFGIPPNNIQVTDTAQLLGLHVAKMALEDAGIVPGDPVLQEKNVNVILGVTGTQELVIPLGTRLGFPVWEKALDQAGVPAGQKQRILEYIGNSFVQWQENSFPGLLGNVVAGRIANRLNLSGTNSVSDAACASSLAAVHTAVMELAAGRCDMSITGGVDTLNDIFMHMCFAKTGVLSHTGDARPFSSDADGTVLGEGVGMLVLKRLEDAQKDNDRIYALIKGMGTSSDGRTSGIYAPDANGQLKALHDAYERAGVDPASVGLVEAHGTGTRVGDKVEFTALRQCYGDKGTGIPTALGSVKSMIGHTKAAAGAAGMIKAILALYNKVLPPTLKITEPDPQLAIDSSRFYLNQEATPWVSSGPRRSGVSAFGFGGSNFHVVLEEAQGEKTHVSWDGSVQIFAFSASDREGLLSKLTDFSQKMDPASMDGKKMDALDDGQKRQYIDALAHGSRVEFSHEDPERILAVYRRPHNPENPADVRELVNQCIQRLTDPDARLSLSACIFYGQGTPRGDIGFLFPGQGSQYPNMGRQWFSVFPEAMKALDDARKIFSRGKEKQEPGLDEFLFPLPGYARIPEKDPLTLQHTQIAQPAIGAVSLAMTKVLERFGVCPSMTCGHSFGELSALAGAGWISQEDFFFLARVRGELMAEAGLQSQDSGSMLAIQAGIDKIEALIREENLDLVIANRNAPLQGVVSGRTDIIDRAKSLCRKRKMRAVKLPVAAAFHSSLVDQAAAPFTERVKDVAVTPSKIPVLSNTTGQCYPDDSEKIIPLLGRQLANPVDFITNVNEMYEKGIRCFVEVGPKSVLTGLTRAILKGKKDVHTLTLDTSSGNASGNSSARHSSIVDLAKVLADLAAMGYPLDLGAWEDAANMPETGKIMVPVFGANPKPESAVMEPVFQPYDAIDEISVQDASPGLSSDIETNKGHSPMPHTQLPNNHHETVHTSPAAASSLQMLQEGFEAIKQLQAQTARAHEKFLETQAAAGKTLGAMLEHSRMAVTGMAPAAIHTHNQVMTQEPARNVSRSSVSPANGTVAHVSAPHVPAANGTSQTAPSPALSGTLVLASPEPSVPTAQQESSSDSSGADSGVMNTLREIVSQLTGYPVEMLEPSMNMESDLGIDSIKKVEILSELEKRFPQARDLSPDHMARVATLEDMCRALGENDNHNHIQPQLQVLQVSEDEENIEPVQGLNGSSHGGIPQEAPDVYAVLVDVVSQLTGFPVDMLEPSMELDSDLGVDSIKRVEILSFMEKQMPDLPNVSPDEMAKVKTLEDIAKALTADAGSAQGKKKLQKQLIHP